LNDARDLFLSFAFLHNGCLMDVKLVTFGANSLKT
jgi:hypothetical protein